ncbi:MAG: 8-amino-7-oxononanoate synthase, partial [Firmicutes bacterium]|nr:8-amino-7-oxononanoate synthase [Bacillota bacterium]
MKFIEEEIANLRENHLFRRLNRMDGSQVPWTAVNGKPCLLLSSNNYLGLTDHPELKSAATEAVARWGTGTGGSRLTTGNFSLHEELESAVARFKGTEAAIVFNSGYMANAGAITALAGKKDVILSDELNHASIIDGCRLSGAKIVRFKHNDVKSLKDLLAQYKGRRRLLVTEGVFSMDGDTAPLAELRDLAQAFSLIFIVDDAHGTGVLGPGGRGTVAAQQIPTEGLILTGTLSKALGSLGGFVAGAGVLIDYIVNHARPFIFTTALPAASAAAALAALEILEDEPEILKLLWENVNRMYKGLTASGFAVAKTSPIIPLILGSPERALRLAGHLLERGYYVPAIRPPAVPRGTARLR